MQQICDVNRRMIDEYEIRADRDRAERRRQERQIRRQRAGAGALGIAGASLLVLVGVMWTIPAYARYQTVLNAKNQVKVNEIMIAQQKQLIEVEQRKAMIRVEEAKGIAESQRIIDASLTLNYLQYLAIKAQEKMAGSPSHTQIYIPSGANGIPLVKTVD